ncbi:MAG: DUF5320 domain-containing protein [Firmicutes bacterium]|nr:DUF5320 domain-containing protein [Bacillota bacterium]
MPKGDFTGPWGLGPMTGRGAGFCAGYPVPGYANPAGRGRGFGRGRGRGWGYRQPMWGWQGQMGPGYPYGMPAYGNDPETEASALKQTAEALELELKQIKQRLAELEDDNQE